MNSELLKYRKDLMRHVNEILNAPNTNGVLLISPITGEIINMKPNRPIKNIFYPYTPESNGYTRSDFLDMVRANIPHDAQKLVVSIGVVDKAGNVRQIHYQHSGNITGCTDLNVTVGMTEPEQNVVRNEMVNKIDRDIATIIRGELECTNENLYYVQSGEYPETARGFTDLRRLPAERKTK